MALQRYTGIDLLTNSARAIRYFINLPHRTFVWVPPICCGRIIVFLTGMS
ncbi:hypothetical protein PITCH_A2030251 [uncultured Desulfobacterium sp.]|uniref:Uncharacterized protein n=1 Tax=uncultured Desulfobacterium sp. TaxID=201089 RepID=A0A445MX97_9BACT|nr:hypothetical protein PITCH_A2030251 [uncultured Desulfobacterium sp.]